MIETKTLLDCGAGGIFLDQNFAWKHNLRTTKLKQPIRAWNMDGTDNKQGTIQFYTDLNIRIGDWTFSERFYITGLGNQKVILRLPWLRKHNPEIDWEKGMVTWRNSEQSRNNGDKKGNLSKRDNNQVWKKKKTKNQQKTTLRIP